MLESLELTLSLVRMVISVPTGMILPVPEAAAVGANRTREHEGGDVFYWKLVADALGIREGDGAYAGVVA